MERIADAYHCEINDITSNNLHITDFKKLMPGTKLKIPFLSKETIEKLEETESFISDYYPTLKDKKVEKKPEIMPVINEEKVIETIKNDVKNEGKNEPKIEEKRKEDKTLTNPKNTYLGGFYSGNIVPNIPQKYIKKI